MARWYVLILLVSLTTFSLIFAFDKSTIWKPVMDRSTAVVSGEALKSCSPCGEDQEATFKIITIFKGMGLRVGDKIKVVASEMTFDHPKRYILFLQKNGKNYKWTSGDSTRIEASGENEQTIRRLMHTTNVFGI